MPWPLWHYREIFPRKDGRGNLASQQDAGRLRCPWSIGMDVELQTGKDVDMDATKQCPYCAETILAAAIKCKHCGSVLVEAAGQPNFESTPTADYGWMLLSIPIVGLLLIAGWAANLSLIQGPASAANLIVLFVVASTAAIAGLEASKLRMGYDRKEGTYSAVQWTVIILLLWIIGYPTYLFKRRRYGRSNLLIPGITVSLLFLGISVSTLIQIGERTTDFQHALDNVNSVAAFPARPIVADAVPPVLPTIPQSSPTPPPVPGTGLPSPGVSFDTVAYCKKISQAVGGSHQIEAACRDEEKTARATFIVRPIPASVESYCHKVAEAVGGSYQIMNACVDQELAAKSTL